MDLSAFDKMDAPALRRYVEFLLWHYRVIDSFWFIFTSERYGRPQAESLNEQVWERVSGMGAKRLVEAFDLDKGGLEGFVEAVRLYPWTPIVGYGIEERDGEVIIEVQSCPPQEARRSRGLEEYECSEMHRREFVEFAKVIDPKIRVHCDFAPPGERPEGLDCRWRFTLADEPGGAAGEAQKAG